jgi:protein-S-isoprenylcysteine O-methyltransferase Ste14
MTHADDQPQVPRGEPGLADRLWRFNDWALYRVPGGAGLMRPRHAINLHKGSVGPLVLLLMVLTNDFSLAAWLYLALHGLYGILWIAKDVAFGDPNWRRPSSLGSFLLILVFPLGLYYVAPLVMFTPLGRVVPGGWGSTATLPLPVAFAAVVCFVLGAFFHFVGDAQKYYVLRHQRPRQLITEGLFALTRNPNYFGEMLIYASFCLLAQHWLPWAACALVWLLVFVVNMLHKERSMSRYPEHAAWKARTGFLFPKPGAILRALPGAFRTPTE